MPVRIGQALQGLLRQGQITHGRDEAPEPIVTSLQTFASSLRCLRPLLLALTRLGRKKFRNVNKHQELSSDRAAVILAGGAGSRLKPLTSRIAGEDVPKQYCRLLSKQTLLDQTRNRVALVVDPALTLVAVTQEHERFYRPLLTNGGASKLVVQPQNRGTAPAILYALLRLAKRVPRTAVAVFPCDHYVSDDRLFMHHVELAFQVIASRPELIVLLGITPDHAEPNYGWIDSGDGFGVDGAALFAVRRFWEKPGRAAAQTLLRQGCLWNSFVFIAQLSTLILAIMRAAPALCSTFASLRSSLGMMAEDEAVRRLYDKLPSVDFSRQVLEKCPEGLAVLPVCGVDWSDLGEPDRVLELVHRIDARPSWIRSQDLVAPQHAKFI
jgi:mannose-1-phosphate guanylyltransferase